MFTLAHLSDVHLAPLPAARWSELLNKRLTGYLSWRLNRHRVHSRALADLVRADVQSLRPDHVAITGDLVNIALPGEFGQAADWLSEFGDPGWISLIPGNHDSYVPTPWPRTLGLWAAYMSGDGAGTGEAADGAFPFVRRRGEMVLIGLSTAVPTAPFLASGRLGAAQIAALERILAALEDTNAQAFRVVLIHHPPLVGQNAARKALSDAEALEPVLRRYGPELVLHGHNHRPMLNWLESERGPVPVIGVASASAAETRPHKPLAAYNLYTVRNEGNRWRTQVSVRAYDPSAGAFAPSQDFELEAAKPR